MSTETKIFIGIIGATVLLAAGAAFFLGGKSDTIGTVTKPVAANVLVRPDSWATGSATAKVILVEFSDFECPACGAAEPTVEQLIAKYGDRVRFVYRHFPLSQHLLAKPAAQAAEAAGMQGKFWEYHSLLFAHQPDFQPDRLIGYAKDLGLDTDKFKQDMNSDAVAQRVLVDQTDGNKARVDVTPTFFLDGVKFSGSVSDLDAAINGRLK